MVPAGTPGAIRLGGRLLDGAGDAVPDGMVETWQAGPDGRFGGDFRGFGRSLTDAAGAWSVLTLKPGPVGAGAPHLAVSVFARGLLNRVVTRIYFPDEADANAADPVLSAIDDAGARATLVASATAEGYRFDVHLQGPHETVFFAI